MSVDREEVERIGGLAKLHLTDEEAHRLTHEMNRILEHAERLRGLDEAGEAGGTPVVTDAADRDPTDAARQSADVDPSAEPPPERPAGTRSTAAETPDPLQVGISAFAPDQREGFFVVPPPPGVVAGPEEAEEDRVGGQARSDDAGGRDG